MMMNAKKSMDSQLIRDCRLACAMMKLKPFSTYSKGVKELKFRVESIHEVGDEFVVFIIHIITDVKFFPSCGGFLNGNNAKMICFTKTRDCYLLRWRYEYLSEYEIVGTQLQNLEDLAQYFWNFMNFLAQEKAMESRTEYDEPQSCTGKLHL